MDHERATDTELLIASRLGDERAATTLYARISPMLRALARLTLRDHHLAEDAVQRTFVRVMQVPKKELMKVQDARSWMVRVARNESASLARSLARARARDQRAGERSDRRRRAFDPTLSSASEGFAPGDPIGEAVEELAEELREIVYLRHVAGLTFDQIESATGINRNTASSRHRLAMRRLREALAPDAGTPDSIPLAAPPIPASSIDGAMLTEFDASSAEEPSHAR